MKGKIKWYNTKKKYGYITLEDGSDLFMHVSGIRTGRTMIYFEDGDVVEFEQGRGLKGPVATNVRLVTKVEDLPKEDVAPAPAPAEQNA